MGCLWSGQAWVRAVSRLPRCSVRPVFDRVPLRRRTIPLLSCNQPLFPSTPLPPSLILTSNPHSYPLGNSSPKFPHPLHWTESKIGALGGPAGQLARFGGCERQHVRVRCPNCWYTVGLHHIVDPNPKPQTLNLISLPPPLSRCGWTAKATPLTRCWAKAMARVSG